MNYEHKATGPPQFPVINANIVGKVNTFCSGECVCKSCLWLNEVSHRRTQSSKGSKTEPRQCKFSLMSPRYVMRKNLRRTSPGCPRMLCATKTLTFKTRVSANSLWCKGVSFAWDEYEIFFKPTASHLASLWHWALGQLQFLSLFLFISFFCFSLVFQHVG